MKPLGQTLYLAADGFVDELVTELGSVDEVRERLVAAAGPPRPAAWAQNVWLDPVAIPAASIGEAAKALRAIQRNWVSYVTKLHGRARLIQDRLPPLAGKPFVFGSPVPTAPLGSWTLWDEHTVVAAAHCSSPFPHGEIRFAENKEAPPNRAYLKLWEALTVAGRRPRAGETCLDLGSSPGGWTWVLQQCGARVVSVDKAPLAPAIAALPGVEFRQQSAFALEPHDIGPIDWLCCDVICYPERLWKMITRWLAAGTVRNFVCTLKFQGATDHAAAAAFAAVSGARLMHLSHNKHELTWILLRSDE